MQLVPGGTVAQAKYAFDNLKTVLAAANSSVEKVVKCTVFLTNMSDFASVNEEYKKGNYKNLKYFHFILHKRMESLSYQFHKVSGSFNTDYTLINTFFDIVFPSSCF